MNKTAIVSLASLASVFSCVAGGTAHAEDPMPLVNVAPSGGTFFDAPLPASQYFKLQFAPANIAPSMMVVRIWPFATRKTCEVNFESLAGTRQFHELAMMPNNDANHPAFVATIPPLQVGQRFCVSIESFVPLTGDLIKALVAGVADEVVADLTPASTAPTLSAAPLASPATPVPPAAQAGGPAPLATPVIAFAAPTVPKDKLRDSIATRLNLHFKLRYGRPLQNARGPAGKAAELIDISAINAYRAALVTRDAALTVVPPDSTEVAKKETALSAGKETLTKSISDALSNDAVKTAFAYEQLQSGATVVGDGTSASAANYAAIDTGVVAAFPLRYAGGNGNPWALPYVGLNLYFTPVDRTIPLSQLVDQAGQRISLTIGRTLSSPTIPNRTITDFGFGFPVLAVGYRVSQFVRATAGSVFYKINIENPTSADTVFGVAPFVGLALDGDVIAIAQGKLFSPALPPN
jgi:hypothetical protein